MNLKEVITEKICKRCGGKYMQENLLVGQDVHESLTCENECFVTLSRIKEPTNIWARYVHKDGKSYMQRPGSKELREVHLKVTEKSVSIGFGKETIPLETGL